MRDLSDEARREFIRECAFPDDDKDTKDGVRIGWNEARRRAEAMLAERDREIEMLKGWKASELKKFEEREREAAWWAFTFHGKYDNVEFEMAFRAYQAAQEKAQ